MTTTVVKTIGSGGDYTSLQAWNDAAPASLVTADQIWQGNCLSGFSVSGGTSTVLTIGGSTSDATRYKLLTTAAGASFRDNANVAANALKFNASNGVAISASTSYTAGTITINEAYARISKLQIENLGTGTSPTLKVTAANVRVDGCIISGQGTAPQGGALYVPTSGILVTNSLLVNRGSSTYCVAFFEGSSSGSLINCTLVIPSDKTAASSGLIAFSYATGIIAKNCALFGGPPMTSGAGSRITFTTCANEQSSPPSGVTQVAYNTTTGSGFVGITDSARDFRIQSSSTLKDVGTTDSTNAATDIAGTARPVGSGYDIGAWEANTPPFRCIITTSPSLTANLVTGRILLTPTWATNPVNVSMKVPGSIQMNGPTDPVGTSDPNSVNKRLAFSGMWHANGKIGTAADGGHTDSTDNGVYSLDLTQNSPAWSVLHAPSSPQPNPVDSSGPFYGSDGSPVSAHTYWMEEYVPSQNRVFRTHVSFPGIGGGAASQPYVDAFSLATNTWDAHETWPDNTYASTSCMDAYGILWGNSTVTNHLYKFDATLGSSAWVDVGAATDMTGSPLCDDPVRNRLIVFCYGDGQGTGTTTRFYTLSKVDATQIAQTVNSSAAYTTWQGYAAAYQSVIYDKWNDRFIVFDGNNPSTIFVLTPPATGTAWDMTTLTITGAALPTAVGAGSYNRFRISEDLGGIVYFPAGDQSVYFIRLAGTPYSLTVTESGTSSDTVNCTVIRGAAMSEALTGFDSPAVALFTLQAMTESGTVADTTSGLTTRAAAITEAGTAAETTDGTKTASPGAMVESGTAAETTNGLTARTAAQAEAGTAADAPSASLATLAPVSEVGTAADSSSTNGGGAVAMTEAGAASDITSANAVMTASTSENGTSAETVSTTASFSASSVETGSAADTITSNAQGTLVMVESGAATDIQASSNVSPGVLTEAGTAADASGTNGTVVAALVEAGTAVESVSDSVASTLAVVEAGTGADTQSSTAVGATSVNEVLNASDNDSASAVMNAGLTEAGTITDFASTAGTLPAGLVEAGSASEAVAGATLTNAGMTDTLTAVESLSSTAGSVLLISEAGSASDSYVTSAQFNATQLELVNATDNPTASAVMHTGFTDVGALADTVTPQKSSVYNVGLTDTLLISEAMLAGDGTVVALRPGRRIVRSRAPLRTVPSTRKTMMTNVRPPVLLDDKDVSESDTLTFDFSKFLQPLETVLLAVIAVDVVSGVDAAPSSMLQGSATAFGPLAMQKITGGVNGCVYHFRCTVTTSHSRQLVQSGLINVVTL
jgi:hypothetical protein